MLQCGPLVKRLRRRPLTPQTWVRFPHGSPLKQAPSSRSSLPLRREEKGKRYNRIGYFSWRDPVKINQVRACMARLGLGRQLVLIAVRVHPFPSRTRKLSSLAPTILGWRRPGKIGNANTKKRRISIRLFFFCALCATISTIAVRNAVYFADEHLYSNARC